MKLKKLHNTSECINGTFRSKNT